MRIPEQEQPSSTNPSPLSLSSFIAPFGVPSSPTSAFDSPMSLFGVPSSSNSAFDSPMSLFGVPSSSNSAFDSPMSLFGVPSSPNYAFGSPAFSGSQSSGFSRFASQSRPPFLPSAPPVTDATSSSSPNVENPNSGMVLSEAEIESAIKDLESKHGSGFFEKLLTSKMALLKLPSSNNGGAPEIKKPEESDKATVTTPAGNSKASMEAAKEETIPPVLNPIQQKAQEVPKPNDIADDATQNSVRASSGNPLPLFPDRLQSSQEFVSVPNQTQSTAQSQTLEYISVIPPNPFAPIPNQTQSQTPTQSPSPFAPTPSQTQSLFGNRRQIQPAFTSSSYGGFASLTDQAFPSRPTPNLATFPGFTQTPNQTCPGFGISPNQTQSISAPFPNQTCPGFGGSSTPNQTQPGFTSSNSGGFASTTNQACPFGCPPAPGFIFAAPASPFPPFGMPYVNPFYSNTSFAPPSGAPSTPYFGVYFVFATFPQAQGFGPTPNQASPWSQSQSQFPYERKTHSPSAWGSNDDGNLQSVSATQPKSHEELRWEDHQKTLKGIPAGWFGSNLPGKPSVTFGTTPGVTFGTTPGVTFGTTPGVDRSPTFGNIQSMTFDNTRATGFGQSPTFGNTNETMLFRPPPVHTPIPFGQTSSSTSSFRFGNTSSSPVGLFGNGNTSSTKPSIFGSPPSIFGQSGNSTSSTPQFGPSSASAFGGVTTSAFGPGNNSAFRSSVSPFGSVSVTKSVWPC